MSARPQPLLLLAERGSRRHAVIGMTPLIDVVFILLIFFMLASSFMKLRAVEVSAPVPGAVGAGMDGAMLVELRHHGLRLSGLPVSRPELLQRIGERLNRKPEQRVLVKAAAGITLQDTVVILDALNDIGVVDMSLVRDQQR